MSKNFNCTYILCNDKHVQLYTKNKNGRMTCSYIKSGDKPPVITKFKYFRLYVTATSGQSTIQFTHLKFYSDAGNTFSYWDGTESKSTIGNYVNYTINKGTVGANGGEAPIYGLLTNVKEGKCCIVNMSPSESSPFIITYELLTKTLDVAQYNNWCWYTANDTATNTGRNITKFKLQVSNTARDDDWITVDENTDPSNIKTTANWSLAYEHELKEIE